MNSSSSVPLSFEALEDGLSISFTNEISYRIDGGTWKTLLARENTEEVNKGSVISFRHSKSISTTGVIGQFSINKKCNVSGVCSSIIPKLLGEKYMAPNLFESLFLSCDTIVDASKLVLPATTLADSCYYNMFRGCTSLTKAPSILPATKLASSCYGNMFYGCTSLTTAPDLPATKLENYCYSVMFQGCTSLTTAPELPAITLANNCYRGMFRDCSKLNYIKAMFTTPPDFSYTESWVKGVSLTGTFVKNKDATWNVTGVYGVPNGWTIKTE